MYAMARPYYRRVGFVARAMAEGSQAVTAEQFDEILRSPRPVSVAAIGMIGFLHLGWLAGLIGAPWAIVTTGIEGLLALLLTRRWWRAIGP